MRIFDERKIAFFLRRNPIFRLNGEIVYLFIIAEFSIQQHKQQNCRVHNTNYAYTDTRGRLSRHLHSNRKIYKIHLISTMLVRCIDGSAVCRHS